MLKFKNYLQKYLIEDVYFYRNDTDNGIVVSEKDKRRAKYTYYSKEINGQTKYFVKTNNGFARNINATDYEIARDGLPEFINKHPEMKNDKDIQKRMSEYYKKYPEEKNQRIINNFDKKFSEINFKSTTFKINSDELLSKINDLYKNIGKTYGNNKDVINFIKKIKSNSEQNYRELQNNFDEIENLIDEFANNNFNNIDDIKILYKEIIDNYRNINSLYNNINNELNRLISLEKKLKEKYTNNEIKHYNPSTDKPIDFQEIQVSSTKEAEKILKEKCGLEEVLLEGINDKKVLSEIVTSIVKMHEYHPEIFDKEHGDFKKLHSETHFYNQVDSKIEEMEKNHEFEKMLKEKVDFDNKNISFSTLLHNICDIVHGDDVDENDNEKMCMGASFILTTFQFLEKYKKLNKNYYKEVLGPFTIYGNYGRGNNRLAPFNKKGREITVDDFFKFLRKQDKNFSFNKGKETYFAGITNEEIYNDIKEYVTPKLLEEIKNNYKNKEYKKINDTVINCKEPGTLAYFNKADKKITLKCDPFEYSYDYIKNNCEYSYKSGHNSSGTNYPVASILLHEMGHAVDACFAMFGYDLLDFCSYMSEYSNLKNIHLSDKIRGYGNSEISEYGRKKNEQEMFAETFSAYYESPERYKEKIIKKIMDTYFSAEEFLRNIIKTSDYKKFKKIKEDEYNLMHKIAEEGDTLSKKEIDEIRDKIMDIHFDNSNFNDEFKNKIQDGLKNILGELKRG